MEKQELLNIISNKHQGAYVQVTYQTNITPNKNFKGHIITKVVQSVVRFGVRYSNIKSVIEKRQAIGMVGEIKEVLPWGEWKNRWMIENKGETYIRMTTSKIFLHRPKVIGYYFDGNPITREEAMGVTQPSQWVKKETPEVFNKNIKDILAVK